MMRRLKQAVCTLIVAMLCSGSVAAGAERAAVLEMLKQPGVHAIMRHALAPGFGDPAAFRLDDCATQRNLDSRGRGQSGAIGKALRDAGVAFNRILTSQWCRCRETAALVDLGPAMDFPALNSFFQDRSTADQQTQEVRAFLSSLAGSEKVLLVTHQVNITALTGQSVSSGEVFLIKASDAGIIEVVGEFLVQP